MKPETKVTTLQAQRERRGGGDQPRRTPSFLLQSHRAIPRTGHQSQHFGRRTCYHPGFPSSRCSTPEKWYVVANFREAEVRHMAPGSEAIVYLSSVPNQRFPRTRAGNRMGSKA